MSDLQGVEGEGRGLIEHAIHDPLLFREHAPAHFGQAEHDAGRELGFGQVGHLGLQFFEPFDFDIDHG